MVAGVVVFVAFSSRPRGVVKVLIAWYTPRPTQGETELETNKTWRCSSAWHPLTYTFSKLFALH